MNIWGNLTSPSDYAFTQIQCSVHPCIIRSWRAITINKLTNRQARFGSNESLQVFVFIFGLSFTWQFTLLFYVLMKSVTRQARFGQVSQCKPVTFMCFTNNSLIFEALFDKTILWIVPSILLTDLFRHTYILPNHHVKLRLSCFDTLVQIVRTKNVPRKLIWQKLWSGRCWEGGLIDNSILGSAYGLLQ